VACRSSAFRRTQASNSERGSGGLTVAGLCSSWCRARRQKALRRFPHLRPAPSG
jgi:hypothetical protein